MLNPAIDSLGTSGAAQSLPTDRTDPLHNLYSSYFVLGTSQDYALSLKTLCHLHLVSFLVMSSIASGAESQHIRTAFKSELSWSIPNLPVAMLHFLNKSND